MTETPTATIETPAAADATPVAEPAKKEESLLSFVLFLLKLLAIVLIIRCFVFAPFSIPSESMLPRLLNGDHLIASKWSYGFSNQSLPFGLAPFPNGRLFASQPERGDVAIFKHPLSGEDYIKRVIGLPGDTIQMKGGVLFINGEPVKKEAVADFVQLIDAGMIRDAELNNKPSPCFQPRFEERHPSGERFCRYKRFRETLPNGVTYNVLDFGAGPGDDMQADPVPQGHLFMMGDNRDNSRDSRWPALPGEAVGMVPQDLLVGKAQVMMWSTDGGSEWIKPWTWFTAARWGRIGGAI